MLIICRALRGEVRRFVTLGVVHDDPELAGDVLQSTFAKAIEFGHTARVPGKR